MIRGISGLGSRLCGVDIHLGAVLIIGQVVVAFYVRIGCSMSMNREFDFAERGMRLIPQSLKY